MTPQQRKARREFIQKRRYEGAKFPDIMREMHGKPRQAAQTPARQKPATPKSTTNGRAGFADGGAPRNEPELKPYEPTLLDQIRWAADDFNRATGN